MNEYFEQTLLPFNKKESDKSKIVYESIFINKSLIDDLCDKEDLESYSCFLLVTIITLTKYTNNTNISILTNINSHEIPLIINDENRKETVNNYMKKIEKNLNHPINHDCAEGFNFNFIYGDDCDVEYENTTLIVRETSQFYSLELKFDEYRYNNSYIRFFLKSIKKVINQLMGCGFKQLKIEDIELREEKPVPKFKFIKIPLVNELFEYQVNKTPEKIALRTCGESYTFRQVNDEANKIANALIKRGIKKGSKISFLLPRDVSLITTFFGIIKAGCVAIPLDMDYPSEKIRYIRQNSNSKYIITHENMEDAIDPSDLINEGDVSFPEVSLKADDPICILHTSGSTGNPKGVVITHENVSNICNVHVKKKFKKILTISSLAFDISESDIFVIGC